jgi:hypothetical protein
MPGLVRMSLDSPEETRPFEDGTGQLQLVNVKEGGVRFTLLGGQQATLIIDPTSGQIRATNFLRRQPGRNLLATDSQRDDHRPVDQHTPISTPGQPGLHRVRLPMP